MLITMQTNMYIPTLDPTVFESFLEWHILSLPCRFFDIKGSENSVVS